MGCNSSTQAKQVAEPSVQTYEASSSPAGSVDSKAKKEEGENQKLKLLLG